MNHIRRGELELPEPNYSNHDDHLVNLPILAWQGDEQLSLPFPKEWDVKTCHMRGASLPPLQERLLREALQNPVGSPPLLKLAEGKKEIVIIFDDLKRPTPTSLIIPLILEELAKAGIRDDQISFVAGIGAHNPMSRDEMVKKLGQVIVERFLVFNHNVYDNLVEVGKTSRGIPVWINRHVMSCDLKIGIGTAIPHIIAGYGGGAKIMIPGVAGLKTIQANHSLALVNQTHSSSGSEKRRQLLGHLEGNAVRSDMEEAARIAGLDFKIDVVLNARREITGLFAGDFVQAHRAACSFAEGVYETTPIRDADVVVSNAYPIEGRALKALWPALVSLKKGGDFVLILQCPQGQSVHYLSDRFGKAYGGIMWRPFQGFTAVGAKRIFVLSDFQSKKDKEWLAQEGTVFWVKKWEEIVDILVREHGAGTKVAIFPYATIQYCKEA